MLPGRASLDELRARLLEPRGEYYPPERYARVLPRFHDLLGIVRALRSPR